MKDEEPVEADGDGDGEEGTEPHEVALAREEVNALLAEQRKTAALKVGRLTLPARVRSPAPLIFPQTPPGVRSEHPQVWPQPLPHEGEAFLLLKQVLCMCLCVSMYVLASVCMTVKEICGHV